MKLLTITLIICTIILACSSGGGGDITGDGTPITVTGPPGKGIRPNLPHATGDFNQFSNINLACSPVMTVSNDPISGDGLTVEQYAQEFFTRYGIRIGGDGVTKERLDKLAQTVARIQEKQADGTLSKKVIHVRSVNLYNSESSYISAAPCETGNLGGFKPGALFNIGDLLRYGGRSFQTSAGCHSAGNVWLRPVGMTHHTMAHEIGHAAGYGQGGADAFAETLGFG